MGLGVQPGSQGPTIAGLGSQPGSQPGSNQEVGGGGVSMIAGLWLLVPAAGSVVPTTLVLYLWNHKHRASAFR